MGEATVTLETPATGIMTVDSIDVDDLDAFAVVDLHRYFGQEDLRDEAPCLSEFICFRLWHCFGLSILYTDACCGLLMFLCGPWTEEGKTTVKQYLYTHGGLCVFGAY